MADVNTPDAIPATNASNTTRYFNLPLFLATDKPSWLVDWNGAMGKIDSILEDIATASEGAVADVHTIQTQIDALNAIIPNLEATVQTAVKDVAAMQTTIDSHETRMDSIEQDLITQNNLIKTLSDSVVAMQATVATLTNRVAAMESSISTMGTNVDAINAELTTIRSSMSSLDTRVTALEQSGGGSGMPALSDLTFTSTTVGLNSLPTSSGTIFTAQEACYAIVEAWGMENIGQGGGGTVGEGKVLCSSHGVPLCTAYFNFNTAYPGYYEAWATSGMIKLKAGDTIQGQRSTFSADGNAAVYIHTAPVA